LASASALLNKPLRTVVVPILRDARFQQVDARNGWAWRNDLIWVFNIRAVGSYFSHVTGWPPGSVCTWLGVFFTFAPCPRGIKIDDQGRLRPAEHLCHMRTHLDRGVDQSGWIRRLRNPAERERTDIWWVQPDGENGDEVAGDIAKSLHDHGLPWYARVSTLESALRLVEAEHDCFVKLAKSALLARRLGDDERWRKYDALAETEARRIGHSLDRDTWLGI
jgi:hypothetical protein